MLKGEPQEYNPPHDRTVAMSEEKSVLFWLDKEEEDTKSNMYKSFGELLGALERQIDVLSAYVPRLARSLMGSSTTFAQLKKCKDDDYV